MIEKLVQIVQEHALPFSGIDINYDELSEQFKTANIVLLGEATHGTDEFYRIRAQITKELITNYGFNAIAIEGDWPDVYQLNRYIQGFYPRNTSIHALSHFKRFPLWMWRNKPILELIRWLRSYNDWLNSSDNKIGLYGLDLYSLHTSIEEIVKFLDKYDPKAAAKARERYKCLDTAIHDPEIYGYLSNLDLTASCAKAVTEQLIDLNQQTISFIQEHKEVEEDEYFHVIQNAHLVKNAEAYYRNMFREEVSTWNLRDKHMFDTLQNIQNHLTKKHDKQAKIIVWAHNSHIGNAKATEMGKKGEFNIGQLAKESYGNGSVSVGFTTYSGTVTAATKWGDKGKMQYINPALPGSYENLFHSTKLNNFILPLNQSEKIYSALCELYLLERAIGVIYRPETERISHYFNAILPQQFDIVCHVDTTTAIESLLDQDIVEEEELPDTFPTGL